jgi:hypothetical protein
VLEPSDYLHSLMRRDMGHLWVYPFIRS